MALDVYVQTDLERGIVAILTMCVATYAANDGRNTEHAAGALDFAQATARLYGLDWPALVASCKAGLGAGARDLLDAALQAGALEG